MQAAVRLPLFLDEGDLLLILTGNTADPKRGQQVEIDHAIAIGNSPKLKVGDGGQVIVLADRCFDAILLRADDALVLLRAGDALCVLGGVVGQVPDSFLGALRVPIDDCDFFRRGKKCQSAARLHKKT